MARRFIVGIAYCILFYFLGCMLVGSAAGCGAAARVEPGQDVAVVASEAGREAVQNSRHIIAFAVVGFVFFGTRMRLLPGTRANGSPLARR